jgi:hypothetical protein
VAQLYTYNFSDFKNGTVSGGRLTQMEMSVISGLKQNYRLVTKLY